jgi:hypothetical protein
MSIRAGVGSNYGTDAFAVGATAAQDAVGRLGVEPSALVVFASSKYDQGELLRGVRSVASRALLVGSSTAGEITTEGPLKQSSVAVMALASDDVRFFGAASATPVSAGPRDAGKSVAEAVKSQLGGEELKAFVMLPDVLKGSGSEIVRGILDVLGANFPVVGGASGDDFQFKQTFQYLGDKPLSDTVVGLGLTGNAKIGIGVKHGWIPVGAAMKVTRSAGNVIHEVDGKPAISIYEDYFGAEEAKSLRSETLARLAIVYPIGLKVPESQELLVRDPLSVDEKGSITCAADVPEGSDIWLMVGSVEEAVAVAKEAAKSALQQLGGEQPKAIVIFNCIARNKLFGERAGEEIAAIQEVLGRDVPLIGFYTYGEQAPLGGETRDIKRCETTFHNETVVIAALA